MSNRFVRVQLELGGKDPSYVCDDADPEATAKGLADGAMYNTGNVPWVLLVNGFV